MICWCFTLVLDLRRYFLFINGVTPMYTSYEEPTRLFTKHPSRCAWAGVGERVPGSEKFSVRLIKRFDPKTSLNVALRNKKESNASCLDQYGSWRYLNPRLSKRRTSDHRRLLPENKRYQNSGPNPWMQRRMRTVVMLMLTTLYSHTGTNI